jgi:putative N6-adenine-specific DNA methylase
MPTTNPLSLFAVTAPGLEAIALAELRAFGVMDAIAEPGGVGFTGAPAMLYAANLRLRTASRVVVRVADFSAKTFFELERHARRVPWERFATRERAVRLRVTCRKSRLYHSDAVAERVLAAIAHRAGVAGASVAGEDDDEEQPSQLFTVRFLHDRCTISADSSGALLHRRGYRQAVAKAPLRETLAAAMLLGAGWSDARPTLDPLCGSGTIAIEAALLARRIPPGHARPFAFMSWPEFDARAWEGVHARAMSEALPRAAAPIFASDRDAGAAAAARANAERAGVASDLTIETLPLSRAAAEGGRGWVVTNPPYGVRVGESAPLRDLYARLGHLLRARLDGWRLALLSADRRLESQLRLPLEERFSTTNGGIPVRLIVTPETARE